MYEVAFWSKVVTPLITLVMVFYLCRSFSAFCVRWA